MCGKNALFAFAILIAAVLLPFSAGAAGGGGGGSGVSGGSSVGGDPHLSGIKCSDAGQLVFDQSPVTDDVVLIRGDGSAVEVEGEWKGTFFSSDDAEIVEAGNYTLVDMVNGNKTVNCPGLRFSCKLVNITLKGCTTSQEGVAAVFALAGPGTVPDNVTVEFDLNGSRNKLMHSKDAYSSQLRELMISSIGGSEYRISVPLPLQAVKVQVSYSGCVGRYYAYSQVPCTPAGSAQAVMEMPGRQLKCGGYIILEDRVNCRLQLREDEKEEYENFFPEECKARNDSETCLAVYLTVQECWAFPNGPSRIGCVRKALNISDIASDAAMCRASGKQACSEELRGRVYPLIKFRLYNLEEEAEKMMKDGLLEREGVAGFIVRMEQAKLAFNSASSTKERRDVILGAREDWKDLLAGRKAG